MYFLHPFSSLSPLLSSSTSSATKHASNCSRWTIGGVYFQECCGHLGVWWCCVLITCLSESIQVSWDRMKNDGKMEGTESLFPAVQNDSLKCPRSAFPSLSFSLSIYVPHCHFGGGNYKLSKTEFNTFVVMSCCCYANMKGNIPEINKWSKHYYLNWIWLNTYQITWHECSWVGLTG